uniref:GATA-type domain-containing protein n=1 Tax=Fagus sylvatica TaxID=28930 RepID=A0A2N9F740_FAGSY
MSSKMRLMQKMMSPNCQATDKPSRTMKNFQNNQQHGDGEINSPNSSNNNTIRVCADCNTTTTPLWRSGPRGPKSLCNACGIRQRKARRAMAEAAAAANGIVVTTDMSSMKSYKVHNKEKKSRTSHVAQNKNKCKLMDSSHHSQKKLSFKDFALSLRNNSAFGRVFPQDEAEAALLLMELSCGLVHS